MKLLDLFSTGTSGTSGTDLQSQGNIPSRSGPAKRDERDQMPDDAMPISVSGPGGPGPDFTNGTEKNTGTVSPSRWSRSSRSENCVGKTLSGSTANGPTPEQLTHARRMLVVCPDMPRGCTVHCWYCSRCQKARTCTAWRHLRSHVEFFRQSTIPYSALVTEATEGRGVIQ